MAKLGSASVHLDRCLYRHKHLPILQLSCKILEKRHEGEDSWPPPPACGFDTPDTLRHRQILAPEDGRLQGVPLETVDWRGNLMHAPAEWEIDKNEAKESHWYHWKVRDALAFTVRDFQGTALVRLLTDSEVAVRADALVALRRLPSDSLGAPHTSCHSEIDGSDSGGPAGRALCPPKVGLCRAGVSGACCGVAFLVHRVRCFQRQVESTAVEALDS